MRPSISYASLVTRYRKILAQRNVLYLSLCLRENLSGKLFARNSTGGQVYQATWSLLSSPFTASFLSDMATNDLEYSLDQEITNFFEKTTVSRSDCDKYAKEHLGGNAVPVPVQGVCSYTVYAGINAEFVAQFRLKSHQLRIEIANLARTIYGRLAPEVVFKGVMGQEIEGKEPLYLYTMSRIRGIDYLDFILAHIGQVPENSAQFSHWRKNLVTDVARLALERFQTY